MDFDPTNSQPFGYRDVSLETYFAQRIISKAYERAMIALYSLPVTLRQMASRNRQIVAAAEDRVLTLINENYQEIEAEIDRLDLLRRQARDELSQLADSPITFSGHSKPKTYRLKFFTPLTLKYINLVEKVDELVKISDELYLLDKLDEPQRQKFGHKWASRLQHLAIRFSDMVRGTRGTILREKRKEEQQRQHQSQIESITLAASTPSDPKQASDASTAVNGSHQTAPDQDVVSAIADEPAPKLRKRGKAKSRDEDAEPDFDKLESEDQAVLDGIGGAVEEIDAPQPAP